MSRIAPAYWYVSSNLGDNLTPWLLQKMGKIPCYVPIESQAPKHVMSGSILSLADGACNVWGVGLGSIDQTVHPDARILAVRGPLSRMRALSCGASCPEVYGDPGLLVPQFYQPSLVVRDMDKTRIGLVPHFVDQARIFNVYDPHDVQLINILGSVEHVASQIVSCDLVVSSALHGLILAVAYGVPFIWAQFSDNVVGGEFKFLDFFMSINIMPTPMDLRGESLPEVQAFLDGPVVTPPKFDVTSFMNVCPVS